jgi:5-methyltetrahydropteroyltriglutamate--homocysteine methyltransferase
MAPKYRADHVGSLLRPQAVLDAHAALRDGRLGEDDVRQIEDAAILDALQLQRDTGIEVLSDGEIRRGGWSGDFNAAVHGYVPGAPAISLKWHDARTGEPVQIQAPVQPAAPGANAGFGSVIGEKLVQHRPLTGHETPFLKAHAGGMPYKVTLPAASYITSRGYKPGVSEPAYPNRKAVLDDVTQIIATEVRQLAAEGVPYIQLDNPHYPDYIDADRVQQMRDLGFDVEQNLKDDIEADNRVVAGIDRANTTVAMHFCRGNGGRGGWHTAGGYDAIAEQVFPQLDYDVLLLEYDSDRSGGFEPLRFVPKGKTVVLGLITTKLGDMEQPDDIIRRIEAASKYIDIDDLALSPQCGFASVAQGNPISPEEQRAKLALVSEVARRVWG